MSRYSSREKLLAAVIIALTVSLGGLGIYTVVSLSGTNSDTATGSSVGDVAPSDSDGELLEEDSNQAAASNQTTANEVAPDTRTPLTSLSGSTTSKQLTSSSDLSGRATPDTSSGMSTPDTSSGTTGTSTPDTSSGTSTPDTSSGTTGTSTPDTSSGTTRTSVPITTPVNSLPVEIVGSPTVIARTTWFVQFTVITNDACSSVSWIAKHEVTGAIVNQHHGAEGCFGPVHTQDTAWYNGVLEPGTSYVIDISVRGTSGTSRPTGTGTAQTTLVVSTAS